MYMMTMAPGREAHGQQYEHLQGAHDQHDDQHDDDYDLDQHDDQRSQGSTCEDVATVVCCGHLANCQLAQEIQERGDKQCKILSS